MIPPTERPTSVYILECAGRVKIGKAVNVQARLRTLKTAAAHEVRLVHSREFPTAEYAFQIETRMHRYFYRERANGEWFDLEPSRAVAFLDAVKPLPKRRRTKSHKGDQRPTPEDLDLMREALDAVDAARLTPTR